VIFAVPSGPVGSGSIYVGILIMWGAFLVAMLVRRSEELSTARPADRHGATSRVLSRRGGRSRDVGVRRAAVRSGAPSTGTVSSNRARRLRVLARRRRILYVLLLATVGAGVAGWSAGLSPWSALPPATMAVAYVAALRRQDRRWVRAGGAVRLAAGQSTGPLPGTAGGPRSDGPRTAGADDGPTRVGVEGGPTHAPGAEGPTGGSIAFLPSDPASVPVRTIDQWAPLPITLPTYVTKPKATRPARVIDLGVPGPWTAAVRAEPESREPTYQEPESLEPESQEPLDPAPSVAEGVIDPEALPVEGPPAVPGTDGGENSPLGRAVNG
jgi:hypothetical protein